MKRFLIGFIVLLLLVGIVGAASATPVQWTVASGGNGHWYELITEKPITTPIPYDDYWSNANGYADDYTHLGYNSYFATITSAAENTFVTALLDRQAWIGGWQGSIGTDPPFEAGWLWVDTGETWSYTNWGAGEPTAGVTDQDYLSIKTNGTWEDLARVKLTGFVIEFDGPTTSEIDPIPEPATMLLLGTGLVGIAGAARRRKKKNQA